MAYSVMLAHLKLHHFKLWQQLAYESKRRLHEAWIHALETRVDETLARRRRANARQRAFDALLKLSHLIGF